MVDGKVMALGKWFPGLVFSPDGKHLVYWRNLSEGTTHLMVDGVIADTFTNLVIDGGPRFTGPNTLFAVGFRENTDYRVEVKIQGAIAVPVILSPSLHAEERSEHGADEDPKQPRREETPAGDPDRHLMVGVETAQYHHRRGDVTRLGDLDRAEHLQHLRVGELRLSELQEFARVVLAFDLIQDHADRRAVARHSRNVRKHIAHCLIQLVRAPGGVQHLEQLRVKLSRVRVKRKSLVEDIDRLISLAAHRREITATKEHRGFLGIIRLECANGYPKSIRIGVFHSAQDIDPDRASGSPCGGGGRGVGLVQLAQRFARLACSDELIGNERVAP